MTTFPLPPNYLVPSPNILSQNSEPFRSSRPPSRASVAATFLVFMLTLSAGTPGFAQNPAPTITQVGRGGLPRGGDTVGRGESLVVRANFSEPIYVTGDPQFTIQVGTQARQADLHFRRGSILFFEYIVQSSDVDADGLSIPADALSLNGGSIRDADGNDADLTHAAKAADPQYKVNGASGVLTVVRMFFSRSPASEDTYVAGETIFVVVLFARGVHVTGAPQLTIQVGTLARRADHLPPLRAAQLLPQGNGFHLPAERERSESTPSTSSTSCSRRTSTTTASAFLRMR